MSRMLRYLPIMLCLGACTASDFVPLVPHQHNPADVVEAAEPAGQRYDKATGTLQPSGIGWALKVFEGMGGETVTGGGAIIALLGMWHQARRKQEAIGVARERGEAINRAKADLPPEHVAKVVMAEQTARDLHSTPPKKAY